MSRRAIIALAALALVGCSDDLPPIGQVRLAIDTDAPLPPPPGEVLGPAEPAPLFDSLRVDVYPPGASEPCAGCSRTFGLDRSDVAAGRASFGLPVSSGVAGYRVRLRLFLAASSLSGEVPVPPCAGCPSTAIVEQVVALPVVGEEGIVDRRVVLRTDEVGQPRGTLDDPVETLEGPVEALDGAAGSLVGTWPHAARVDCTEAAAPGEVCVPGGAYWMGNPHAVGLGGGNDADQRRLVVLAPFLLDATEVTVASYRALLDTLDPALRDALTPIPWSSSTNGTQWRDFCTFTAAPGPLDDEPVVCVAWSQAQQYCQLRGADLPTEAQLEYVAGGLASRLFHWGSDEPSCDDAVIARYGYGIFGSGPFAGVGCVATVPPGGTEPVGTVVDPPRRDRLELPGGTIFDLVGNATEWARDLYNRQSEPCWAAAGVYHEPLCETVSPADGLLYSFRLGSYAVGARQAVAAYRHGLRDISLGHGIDLGFRCARPGR